jgi:hypothetical protein
VRSPATVPPLGTGGGRVRLFLVDDHAIVRAGVRALLAHHDMLEVVGEAESGEEALTRVVAPRRTSCCSTCRSPA